MSGHRLFTSHEEIALQLLAKQPNSTGTDLVNASQGRLRSGAVHNMLRRLNAAGLVRTRNLYGRTQRWRLTEDGERSTPVAQR